LAGAAAPSEPAGAVVVVAVGATDSLAAPASPSLGGTFFLCERFLAGADADAGAAGALGAAGGGGGGGARGRAVFEAGGAGDFASTASSAEEAGERSGVEVALGRGGRLSAGDAGLAAARTSSGRGGSDEAWKGREVGREGSRRRCGRGARCGPARGRCGGSGRRGVAARARLLRRHLARSLVRRRRHGRRSGRGCGRRRSVEARVRGGALDEVLAAAALAGAADVVTHVGRLLERLDEQLVVAVAAVGRHRVVVVVVVVVVPRRVGRPARARRQALALARPFAGRAHRRLALTALAALGLGGGSDERGVAHAGDASAREDLGDHGGPRASLLDLVLVGYRAAVERHVRRGG